MARAQLKMANRKDPYLQSTEVENLFVYEFLPTAPGEYVKVYLFGLMYAQNGLQMDVGKFSRVMKIAEEDILEAWGYWAKKGLMRIHHSNDNTEYEIEYLSLVENLYGKNTGDEISAADKNSSIEERKEELKERRENEKINDDAISKVVDLEIQALFTKYETLTGKMMSSEDARRMKENISTYDILPDIMSFAIDYCVGEDRTSVSQIIRTAVDWAKEGCKNLADVKSYIDEHSKRNSYYSTVFKEMGFIRLPNPLDKQLMDTWFDDMGYTIREVLEACKKTAGMRDPSLKYVNKILENQKLEQGGIKPIRMQVEGTAPVSKRVLKEYYDYIRLEAEKEQAAHIDEVCEKLMDMRELFDLETSINNELLQMTPGIGGSEKRQTLREQRKQIDADKKRLLIDNGYSEDYLDRKYKCDQCKDTGFTDDGRTCSCSEIRAEEAFRWNQKRN